MVTTNGTAHRQKGYKLEPESNVSDSSEALCEDFARDKRHPLYLGDWTRSIPYVDDTMAIDDMDEPHLKRKNAILAAHPEIKELYGVEHKTIYICFFATTSQLLLAYLFGRVLTDYNWTMLFTAWILGGSFTSLYGAILHDTTHNLAHESPFVNRLTGFLANIGIVFPIASSFRRHHLEHHTFQGVVGKDPDLPLQWEMWLVRGNMFLKLIWLFCYALMYVVRGAALNKRLTFWELVNIVYTVFTDALVLYWCGVRGFVYLALSLWLGYGWHLGAMHFIQEHYTFDDGQETYSYYGSGNRLIMNLGYHNEHHDFIRVSVLLRDSTALHS